MPDTEKFEIFFIRHAHTTALALPGFSACDVDISAEGEREIRLLAERFRGAKFDAVFSSPLIRAVKTAAAVTDVLQNPVPLIILPEITEKGAMKTYDGVDLERIGRYHENSVLCPDALSGKNPRFYEDDDEALTDRAKTVIGYFRSRFSYGQKIAVFSHGSFGNHFLGAALGIGTPDFIFSLNNTGVSKIKYTDDGEVRLSFCNDMSHLRTLMSDYEFTV